MDHFLDSNTNEHQIQYATRALGCANHATLATNSVKEVHVSKLCGVPSNACCVVWLNTIFSRGSA